MKIRGLLLLVVGVLGAMYVWTYDIAAGKPVNDITGPKSIAVLMVCAVIFILGICSLLGKCCKK